MILLLIDDHVLFREGVALLLQPLVADLRVRQAGSCEEAFDLLEREGPADLVLMDLGLPGMSGLQGITLFHERYPQTPVVALSSSDDRENVLAALDAGAMGFIPKTSSSAILVSALRLIMAKGIYLPPSAFLHEAVERMPAPEAPRPRPTPSPISVHFDRGPAPASSAATNGDAVALRPADLGLTPRQADVLYQILQGRSAKLIGRELALSPSTVKAHTSAVLRALNVTTRTQAVLAASRLGLRF
jgi:DNA-binding NarL/FixJ family response regulator